MIIDNFNLLSVTCHENVFVKTGLFYQLSTAVVLLFLINHNILILNFLNHDLCSSSVLRSMIFAPAVYLEA